MSAAGQGVWAAGVDQTFLTSVSEGTDMVGA